jgi:hypothetical protein
MSTLVPRFQHSSRVYTTVYNNHVWIQYLLHYTLKQLHTSHVHILHMYVNKQIHMPFLHTYNSWNDIPCNYFSCLSHIHSYRDYNRPSTNIPPQHLSDWCSVVPDPGMSSYQMETDCLVLPCHCSDCRLHSSVSCLSSLLHEYLQGNLQFITYETNCT